MASETEIINNRLAQLVPHKTGPESALYEAVRYSLLSGGKRLRSRIAIATGISCGAPLNALLDPACALEMIHTYSLIHDDLPCMDDDDMRRGKPSLHKAYPEWLALLAGDFLLTKAFEIAADTPHIVKMLAQRSGGRGLIGGQVMDLLASEDHLQEMHAKKTGALFEAAFLTGGMVAGHNELESLSRAGLAFGSAYQLLDDIEDAEQSEIEAEKVTAATHLGIKEAKRQATHLLQQSADHLRQAALHTQEIITLVESLSCKFLTPA